MSHTFRQHPKRCGPYNMFQMPIVLPLLRSHKTSSFPVIYRLNIFPSENNLFSLAAYFRLQLFYTKCVTIFFSLSFSVHLFFLHFRSICFRVFSFIQSFIFSFSSLSSAQSFFHQPHCYNSSYTILHHVNAIFHLHCPFLCMFPSSPLLPSCCLSPKNLHFVCSALLLVNNKLI